MTIRTYKDLSRIHTFFGRYKYLRLTGRVGEETFGSDRYFNQAFYRSREWKNVRDEVIIRDDGCDLGIPGREIHGRILIHHMNPMTIDELRLSDDAVLDPEYLITTTHKTHNAIHYGDENRLEQDPIERRPGDTTLWKGMSVNELQYSDIDQEIHGHRGRRRRIRR